MNYALIGLGFISPRHIQAIRDTGGTLLMTCDIDPAKSADFRDYLEMYDSEGFKSVDIVVICAPNDLHAEMAREASRRGKIVICEKPLTIFPNYKGLDKIFAVSQLRYLPAVEVATDNVEHDNILYIKWHAKRDEAFWKSWKGSRRRSGGLLYIFGPHLFDIAIGLLGDVQRVLTTCHGDKQECGAFKTKMGTVMYDIRALDTEEGQERSITLNGVKYSISNKDNASEEDMHTILYREILAGRGICGDEVFKVLRLIDSLND